MAPWRDSRAGCRPPVPQAGWPRLGTGAQWVGAAVAHQPAWLHRGALTTVIDVGLDVQGEARIGVPDLRRRPGTVDSRLRPGDDDRSVARGMAANPQKSQRASAPSTTRLVGAYPRRLPAARLLASSSSPICRARSPGRGTFLSRSINQSARAPTFRSATPRTTRLVTTTTSVPATINVILLASSAIGGPTLSAKRHADALPAELWPLGAIPERNPPGPIAPPPRQPSLNPRFSSLAACFSGFGEPSSTTPSVLPPRRATPTKHRPAASVYPVFRPIAPG